MEFINSQLMRKDGDEDDDVMIRGGAILCSHDHHHMVPTMSFTDQTTLYQSADDHHLSGPTIQSLGFAPSDRDKSLFKFASPSQTGFVNNNNNNKASLGKKRKRNNINNAVEKPKEVVHVRAKRGQATNSHSLAERVRREKINERLRSLEDLVPGCYKTMGMAVMLDVIINYVRSLQNQIEFLSMKLSAASMFNEMNFFEMAMDNMQSADHQGTYAWRD